MHIEYQQLNPAGDTKDKTNRYAKDIIISFNEDPPMNTSL